MLAAAAVVKRGEWRAAWILVWHAISTVLLAVLLTPWLVSSRDLAAVIPPCEWKARYHKECPFCGMTAAFYEIRSGQFSEARSLNRGAMPLYVAFVVNEVALAAYWMIRK